MPNDLRTRIIAALLSEDDVALMADAVILELGLKQQWLCQHREYNEPPVILSGNPLVQHRYVTEWTTDASNRDSAIGAWASNPTKKTAANMRKAVSKAPAPRKPRKTKLDKSIGSFLDNPTGKAKPKSGPDLPKPVRGGRAKIDKYGVPRNQYGQPISASEYKKLHTLDTREASIKSLMKSLNRK